MRTKTAQSLPRGIRLRGGKYVVDITVAGKRVTRTRDSLAEAIVTQDTLRSQLTSGVNPAPATGVEQWTLEKAYNVTRKVRWANSKAERSANLNATRALEFFGGATLMDDITPVWLDEFVVHLQNRGNNNGGVNRKLAALSVMFTTAVDRGGAIKRPKMPRQKEGMGRIRWLTDAEERWAHTLLTQWGDTDMLDVFIMLTDTGMRLGELWVLTAADISGNMILIWDGKTGHRSVPMTSRVRAIVDLRVTKGGKLFPYQGEWIRTKWTRLRNNMGLTNDPQFVPHMLRHTCASRLVQRGATIPVVQQWLGHKTISMTMRYAHLAPSHLEDAVKLLED